MTKGSREQFVRREIFCILIFQVITHLYVFVSIHWTVYLKRVTFTVWNLYLNKPDFRVKEDCGLGPSRFPLRKKSMISTGNEQCSWEYSSKKLTIIKTDIDTPPKQVLQEFRGQRNMLKDTTESLGEYNRTSDLVSSTSDVQWYGGTSLVVQWLRRHSSRAGGPGLIQGQGTRFHVLQLRPSRAK